ncbi:HNH endonuclease family protein [Nocardia sp. CA-135398]|uniref:HNH endonuclease family protein n=1 Tax=Nocardia sp. CA-135398 TaxID=3239977 RepID=UPI003D95F065
MSVPPGTSGTVRADIRRWLPALTAAALCALPGCVEVGGEPVAPGRGTAADGAAGLSPTRVQLEQLLVSVRVVAARAHPGGYERGCQEGQRCVFGPSWTDDYDGPGGHDGCDTRNNVLNAQLTRVSLRPGTRDCVVIAGTLDDPYTGERITFSKADAGGVQIDHVYPLAAAWDMGAAYWPLERRVRFANDIDVNLLATVASANQAKGDSTPSEWTPRTNRCFYAGRYLTVAVRYDLPVTTADNAVLNDIARSCP